MTISEAFEGVFPANPIPASPPAGTADRPKVVPLHRGRARTAIPARTRQHTVIRAARVVYLDAADSWIAEERSPSAKTVWRTDYTAGIDTVWAPYRVWTYMWRPTAVLFALFCDAIKFLLIHPFRGPLTLTTAAAVYLLATR